MPQNNTLLKVLTKVGLILFGLILAGVFLELLSIFIVNIYQTKQELANSRSFTTKHDITILALGESTTQGGIGSWPNQLEKILNKQNLGYTFAVINEGHSSTTTDRILNNLEDNLNKYHPDIVISMMGINDKAGAPIATLHPESPTQPKPIWEKLHFIKLIKYLLSQLVPAVYATDSGDLVNLANKLSLEQKYQEVEKIIKQFPSIPQNREQYIIRRDFYWSTQRYPELVTLTKQAINIWPDDFEIYLKLGDTYRNLGHVEDALTVYNQALKINSTDPNIYKALGRLFGEDLKNYEQSNQYFQTAIKLLEAKLSVDPKDVNTLLNLEEIYRLQSSSSTADQISQNVLGINNATSVNYQMLATILKNKGIKLIAVQYPMRNVQLLKDMLGDQEIVYVDNEQSFKRAVEQEGYKAYFNDRFGGDFGHTTHKGDFLLASNISKSVEEVIRSSLVTQ